MIDKDTDPRYFVFAYYSYEAQGGWYDLKGKVNSIEEANAMIENHKLNNSLIDSAHIVDANTLEPIWSWYYSSPGHEYINGELQ